MVKNKSKEMNKYFKLFLILLIAGLFILALYGWYSWDEQNKIKRLTGGNEITSAELVFTLLNQEEVEKILSIKDTTLPLLPQFNDQLHSEDVAKYDYTDLVVRLFISKRSGDVLVENAISLFDSEEKAQNFIMTKANELGAKTSYSFNGQVLTLYLTSQGDENNLPSATLRFVIKNLVAKITIYGKNKVIDYTNPDLIGALVIKLATEQKSKIEQLLNGEITNSINLKQTNMALNNLPDKLSETKLIGITPINQNEWLGETGNLEKQTISGFESGAFESFKLQSLDGHVLSILVIEFENKEDALREQELFFNEGIHVTDKTSQVLSLPDSINKFSVGRISDTMAEIQSVDKVYLYDIAIFSPYENLDKEKAKEKIIDYAKEIFGKR